MLTTFGTETAGATNANGVNWVDLLDKSAITKPTEIWRMTLTIAGAWAGLCQVRIVTGAAAKIFPFADYAEQNTDFISGIEWILPARVRATVAAGYRVQFRSSDVGDGAGKTCALTKLAKIEIG